jgi:ABC-type branched-subunit amino acid transport system ATPase component/ABC-type branched-subunit amino acid transport system permease subunit
MQGSPLSLFGSPALVAVVGIAAALSTASENFHYIMTLVLIWAIFGSSWNIISGYGGQMAFGHAVFFGIGAYVTTLLMARLGVSPLIGVWIAMAVAVAASLLIGWPTFKLSGVYFSLATLAYPLMLIPLLSYLGFQEVSIPYIRKGGEWYLQFSEQRHYSYLALGVLVATVAIVATIERSRLGAALLSIRHNEWAAEAAGINAHRTKLLAFAISAAIAAAAGTLYAAVLLVVTPHSVFGLGITVKALMVTLVGGLATVWGALLGSVLLIPLSHFLLSQYGARFPGIDNVVLGLFLMVVIVFAPEGLYWRIKPLFQRFGQGKRRRAPKMPETLVTTIDSPLDIFPHRAAGEPILKTSGLSKSFRGVAAVTGVDFSAASGEIVGVIGPNGAGKTTLMNLINGFVRPDRGEVSFAGERCTGDPPWKMCRRALGRTFQVPRLLERRTVLENVEIGAHHLVSSVGEARGLAFQALTLVGLAHEAESGISALSTAGVRKLELARALVGRPRLLMLDEPLAGLSGVDIQEFSELIRTLKARGLGIVIIEHTMSAMVGLVDRFVVLAEGTVIAAGKPEVVMRDPLVIEAYLGKGWKTHAPD